MGYRNLLRVGVLFAVFASSLTGNSEQVEAGPVVYVAGSGKEFGTMDLTTGAFSSIGTLSPLPGFPPGDTIFGMGFGADGKLYGLDSFSSEAHLFQINISNAAVTDLGSVGMSALGASADAGGKLYALSIDDNANFYTMNPPSTTSTLVGATGIRGSGVMGVAADGGELFATARDSSNGDADLYSINLTTGAATLIGDTGFHLFAGLFVNGTLYGFGPTIITINTATGVGTEVASYSLGLNNSGHDNGHVVFAAAIPESQIASVPEPSSFTIGLISTVMLGSLGIIRKHRRP